MSSKLKLVLFHGDDRVGKAKSATKTRSFSKAITPARRANTQVCRDNDDFNDDDDYV